MKNPIDIWDDSDKAELNCDEVISKSDNYSVDGMSEMVDASEFDADAAFVDGFEIFDSTNILISLVKRKPLSWIRLFD